MFCGSEFNGDISKWKVSNVTNMNSMFLKSQFNGNISKWDVSNVTDMNGMFCDSKFNGNISKWKVSKVTDMSSMFLKSQFNGNISKWDVSNVTDMNCMFRFADFNGDISKWNVSKVDNMVLMFYQIARIRVHSAVSKEAPIEKPQIRCYTGFAVNTASGIIVGLEIAVVFSIIPCHGSKRFAGRYEAGGIVQHIGAPGNFAEVFCQNNIANSGVTYCSRIYYSESIGGAFYRI